MRRVMSPCNELTAFELSTLRIEDPAFVAKSGRAEHAIVRFTGNPHDRVPGMAFELTDTEMDSADRYEPAGYRRVLAILVSGLQAWVYAADTSKRRG